MARYSWNKLEGKRVWLLWLSMKRRLLQNLIEAVWGGDSLFLLGWSKYQWNKFGVTALAVFFVGPMVAYLIGFDPTNAILWFTGIVILAYAIETQELRLQVMVQTQISQQSLIEVIKSNILTQQTFDEECLTCDSCGGGVELA